DRALGPARARTGDLLVRPRGVAVRGGPGRDSNEQQPNAADRALEAARVPASRQRGQVLVLFALLLPALIGIVGLAVDGGRLLAARRHLQAVADAAAWAAATEVVYGTSANAAGTARWYGTRNGESNVTVAQPPTNGPY